MFIKTECQDLIAAVGVTETAEQPTCKHQIRIKQYMDKGKTLIQP